MAKDPKKTIREINEELGYFEDAILSIADTLSNTVKNAITDLKDESLTLADIFQKKMQKSFKDIVNESDKILDLTLKLSKGSASILDVQKAQNNLELKNLGIQRNLEILQKNGLISEEQKEKLSEEISTQYNIQKNLLEDQEKYAEQIQKKMGFTGAIVKDISKIPVLGKLINSQKVLGKIQEEASKKESNRWKTFGVGMKETFKSAASGLTDPLVQMGIIGNIIKFFLDAMFKADKRVTDIAKNFSITKDAAAGVYQSLTLSKDTLDTFQKTTANIVEAFNDLAQLSDFTSIATLKQVETQIVLTKQFGLTKEEALDTQQIFVANNLAADKGVDITYDQIAAFYKQNKLLVDGRKVLTEVGKLSKLIQINFKGNYKELVGTVLEAKKLGFTLNQVSRIGESLLNFEQSIASEIEAELVTGRELNLEEARRYALNNDLLGLTKEISKQGITYERFTNMNRIQQESIAKALGLQASELADSLYKTKIIDKVAKGQTEELKKQADIAEKEGKRDEAARLRKLAISIEQGIADGKSLEAAQKQASAQERFEIALERIKEIFSDLVTGGTLDKLAIMLDRVVVNLEKGNGLFKQFLGFGLSESEYLTEKTKKQTEELTKLNEQYAKATGYEKDRLKIQIEEEKVNLQNLQKQKSSIDYEEEKKVREAFNKINNIKAGGISSGALTGLMPVEKPMAAGGIVRKPTRALVGEAGPEAVVPLNKFYAKMDELITAVNKGGNVYLDSQKVGTAMTVSTYKIS